MSDEGLLPGAQDTDRATTLGEVINTAVELGLRNLMTCIPAKVVKYDASTNKANCQILVKNVTQAEDGSREVHSWPVVPGVIVQFAGAGGYRITCPISDGSDGSANTIGTLFFSARSLDKWSTGTGGEVDPELDHDHALADAIFMPGLLPFGAPWQDVPTDGMSVGMDSGPQAKFTQDLVLLFKTMANAQFVALSNLVDNRLAKIQSTFDSHTHGYTGGTGTANLSTGAVTAVSGTTEGPGSTIGALQTTAATVTKAE